MSISSHIRRNWGTKEGIEKETELFISKSLSGSLVSSWSGYVCVPALLHRSSPLVLTIPLWAWWHHSDFKDENWSAEKGRGLLSFPGGVKPRFSLRCAWPLGSCTLLYPRVPRGWDSCESIASAHLRSFPQIAIIHERSSDLRNFSLSLWKSGIDLPEASSNWNDSYIFQYEMKETKES